MPLRDLSAFFEDDALEYPNVPSAKHPAGKTYRVPSPDAATGLRLTALATVGMKSATGAQLNEKDSAALNLDDEDEESLYRQVLGSATYQEMIDDGVKWTHLQRVAHDAFLTFTVSPEVADAALAVETGKAQEPRPSVSTRATGRKTAGSKSSRGSGATQGRTRGRASIPSSTSPSEPVAQATG